MYNLQRLYTALDSYFKKVDCHSVLFKKMGREGAMGSEDAVAGNGVSVELTNKTPKMR